MVPDQIPQLPVIDNPLASEAADLGRAAQRRELQRGNKGSCRHPVLADDGAEVPVANERGTVELLQAHIATLEAALAKAEEIGKHREHEVELVTSRVADLQAHIATLETALANADMAGTHWQREAELGANRVNDLVAELFKVTSELVEMSKRMAQQTALTDKLKADLDEHRLQSWWWKHGIG
jgi:chromosome segregation ATPase